MPQTSRVWFITGASQGLGRQLALSALARNDRVIATARDISKVQDLERIYNTNHADVVRAMQLDVTASEDELRQKAEEAYAIWGRLDFLVNNAGVGVVNISEEMGFGGYVKQFQTNFFGPINITHAFLPYMRLQRRGTIVFIGSRSSWRARLPLIGPYASSKAALEAAAESLKAELTPLGIRVLTVLPGGIRTACMANIIVMPPSPGIVSLAQSKGSTSQDLGIRTEDGDYVGEGCIADYAELRASALGRMRAQNGTQVGDPVKTADAIVDVILGEGLASHCLLKAGKQSTNVDGQTEQFLPDLLVLGEDAEQNIRERCHNVLRCLDEWQEVTRSISFDHE